MSPRAAVSLVLLACSLQGCALYAALDDSDAQDPDGADLGVVDMPTGDMPGDMASDMTPADMPGDMPPADMPGDMPPVDMPADMQPDMMNMGPYDTLAACQEACRDPQRQCIREEGKPYVCIPTSEAEQRCLFTAPLPTAPSVQNPADFVPTPLVAAAHPDGALVFVSDASRAQLLQPATGLSAGVSHTALLGGGDPVRAEALLAFSLSSGYQAFALGRPSPRHPEQGNLFGQRLSVTATELRALGDLKWSHSSQTPLCEDFDSRILPYANTAASLGRDEAMVLGLFCNTSDPTGRPSYELEASRVSAASASLQHEAKRDLTEMWPFPDLAQLRDITAGDNKFYLLSVDERAGQRDPALRLTPGEWLGTPMDPINLLASRDLDAALHTIGPNRGFGRDGCGGDLSRLLYGPQERGLLRLSADGRHVVFAVPFQLNPAGNDLERLRRWVIASLPTDSTNLAQDMRLRCISAPALLDQREVVDMVMTPSGPLGLALVQERSPQGKPTAVFLVPSSPGDNTALRLLTSRDAASGSPVAYFAQRLLAHPDGGYALVGYQITSSAASVFEMRLGPDGAPVCGPPPMMPN